MSISVGFYKYVYKWITDEQTGEPIYRPFETNVNPYMAKVFIVGSHPTPLLELEKEHVSFYANSLVDRDEYNRLFAGSLSKSREYNGALRFSNVLESTYAVPSAISYINALTADSLIDLKNQKQENSALFYRGFEIFKEVLEELKPPIVLLHGSYALEQFRIMFEGYAIEFGSTNRKLKELEGEGKFGKIQHDDGSESILFACKSLAYFKENNEQYRNYMDQIVEELNGK